MSQTGTMIYTEMVRFIAANNLQKAVALQPMNVVKQRLEELYFKERNNNLSIEEWSELKYLLVLQSLVRLAKGRDFRLPKMN